MTTRKTFKTYTITPWKPPWAFIQPEKPWRSKKVQNPKDPEAVKAFETEPKDGK